MPNSTPHDLIDMLSDLLDKERQALIDGQLDQVARLAAEKEGLVGGLNESLAAGSEDIRAIKNKLSRNQTLLDSAMAGIRAVSEKMQSMRRIRDSLETYDRRGNRFRYADLHAPSVEKRA